MSETNEPKTPGGEKMASELAKALKQAAATRRDDPEAHEIAADDAGASTLAETPKPL